jgi:CubicO group peptidase (beta-lactamase class C family)
VQKRIIKPLQMDNTYVGSLFKDKSNLATPHYSESGTIKTIDSYDIGMGSAAGGIFSNVADMSKWMIVRLNKGKYGTDLKSSLFSLKNHHEMWKLHTVEDTNLNPRYNSHFNGYGLGWFLSDEKGNLKVSHTGGLPGMLPIVTMYPDINLGIVILTNTENGGGALFSTITNTINDSYLGLDDFKWVDEYETWVNGRKNVWVKDKKLWIKSYRSSKLNGPLLFYNANTFAIKWEYQAMNCDAFAIFSLDETSKAQSIKMKGLSPNIDFNFDFQDLDLKRFKK